MHHGIMISLLVGLGLRGRGGDGRAVDGFVQDRVIRVVFLHGGEVVGTFEEMLALTGSIFGADGLAVDALGGEALCWFS